MTLTRKFMSALGIDADKQEQLIEAHTESTDALKAERDKAKAEAEKYRQEAEKITGLEKQVKELTEKLSAAEKKDDYKAMYESEKAEHEKLKGKIAADKILDAKESAYKKALKNAGIPDERIPTLLKVARKTDFEGIEFDEKNDLKDFDKEIENIKAEYGGYIPKTEITGTNPETPPKSTENKDGRTGIAAKIQQEHMQNMYGVQPTANKEV